MVACCWPVVSARPDSSRTRWKSTIRKLTRGRPAASLNVGRADQTATALYDGRIVIAGGRDGTQSLDTIEIYDPDAGVFTLSQARLSAPRTGHATAQLYDGTLIVTGGSDGISVLSSADLYDPFFETIVAGPALAAPRSGHSATTLLSGRVLVAAGRGDEGQLASAEGVWTRHEQLRRHRQFDVGGAARPPGVSVAAQQPGAARRRRGRHRR